MTLANDLPLTFQSHIYSSITKGVQVVLLKLFICHLRYISVQIFIWIIRYIHPYIVQELIVFGKNYNNGNFETL